MRQDFKDCVAIMLTMMSVAATVTVGFILPVLPFIAIGCLVKWLFF